MSGDTALRIALLIGVGVPVLAVLAEVWRAWLRRRRKAAWDDIYRAQGAQEESHDR